MEIPAVKILKNLTFFARGLAIAATPMLG